MSDDVFSIEVTGDVIRLRGELDAHTAPQLDEVIVDAVASGADQLVLDMGGVDFVDSSGLRSLIRARTEGDVERVVVIRQPSAATQRLLEITGMTEHFTIELAG
ncbi:MAG: STAS domain-containing protein [Microthrixaceae bacterium]